MSLQALAYLFFTIILGVVFAAIIVYTYGRKRKEKMEAPKYRILEDEDGQ
ncbi:MAG: cbb3-type cytochrome c oxidase subunit 3 [Deltaproteobacteria bacterium]|nr:MAG: cbb3-type cytochrome c oxidase subunit 3 [Deltaproteobacteria bacterium]